MDDEQYRRRGREMTLNFLEENDLLIHIFGTFNASNVSINEYHDPAEVDPETFHFESRHNFQFEFLSNTEATLSEI
jgi:hypothetical protein